MTEEKVLIQRFVSRKKRERLKKPDWLKIRIGDPTNQNAVLKLIDGLNLHTVCQEARCPNIFECWTDKTATFMLGGDTCTRHCGFCAVNKGKPMELDPMEPTRSRRHHVGQPRRSSGRRRGALGGNHSKGARAQPEL
jgi:lipoic acid synthetase